MAISAAASSVQSLAPAIWQTLQMQQAQRNADQARQNAQALQSEASQAQSAADRADQQARAIGREAQQAQFVSTQADQNLTTAKSGQQVQTQITRLSQNVHQAAQSLQAPPVVNTQGQVTGKVVNVKA
jgi:threonyl-tRNA synthetase